MARKRMLSPDIWRDKKTIQLTNEEFILMIGAISAADDEGIIEPDPGSFFFELGRQELSTETIQKGFDKLFKLGILVKYGDYAFFPNWFKHQYLDKPQPTKHERPPKSVIDQFPKYAKQWIETFKKCSKMQEVYEFPYGPENTLICMKNHTLLKAIDLENFAIIESKRTFSERSQNNPGLIREQSWNVPASSEEQKTTKLEDDPTIEKVFDENIAIEEQKNILGTFLERSEINPGTFPPKRKEKKRKESKLIEPNQKEINKKEPKRTEPKRDDEKKISKKPIGLITSMVKDFLDFNKLEINDSLLPEIVDRIIDKNLDRSFCDYCFEYAKNKNPASLEGYFIKCILKFDSLIDSWKETKGLDFEIKEKIPIKSELEKECPNCKVIMKHDKGEFQCKKCQAVYKLKKGKLEKITAEEIPKEAFKLENYLDDKKGDKPDDKIELGIF
jgi:hypothetical protein